MKVTYRQTKEKENKHEKFETLKIFLCLSPQDSSHAVMK